MQNLSDNLTDLNVPDNNLLVEIGSRVRIKLVCVSSVETMDIQLVQNQFSDFENGLIGIDTPLARAILGKKEDETIPFKSGDIISVYIESISPQESIPTSNSQEERKRILQQVVEDSDRMNALIFASSFSGKWGDYDPYPIDETW